MNELSPGYFGFYDEDELVQAMEREKEEKERKQKPATNT